MANKDAELRLIVKEQPLQAVSGELLTMCTLHTNEPMSNGADWLAQILPVGLQGKDMAERLAAAWNACAGIPTVVLQRYGAKTTLEQIDKTNNALEKIAQLPTLHHVGIAAKLTCPECGGVPKAGEERPGDRCAVCKNEGTIDGCLESAECALCIATEALR